MTSKIQAYQKQIVKLKSQQLDTENSICTLDIRRDQEVAGLLSSLGINLDSIASAGETVGKKKVDKPTPLFDGAKENDGQDSSAKASNAESESKPKVDVLIADKSVWFDSADWSQFLDWARDRAQNVSNDGGIMLLIDTLVGSIFVLK